MSDLQERLLDQAGLMQSGQITRWRVDMALMFEAADRITELEAKLEVAVALAPEILASLDAFGWLGGCNGLAVLAGVSNPILYGVACAALSVAIGPDYDGDFEVDQQ